MNPLSSVGVSIVVAGLSCGFNALADQSPHDLVAHGDTPAVGQNANSGPPPVALKGLIKNTVAASKCSSDSDNLRSAVTGVAFIFGRGICRPDQPWVIAASRGNLHKATDVLYSYRDHFTAAGITISDDPGRDNFRHLFTLMYGLMQRESNGRSCVGKDTCQNYNDADSAEAGLFQSSWGLHRRDPVMGQLAAGYSERGIDTPSCLKAEFDENHPKCSPHDAVTWPRGGNGKSAGEKYQKLAKACPAFATEYAAVGLRISGGNTIKTGEWNPLMRNIKEADRAKVYPSCETMLTEVEKLVEANITSCDQLFQ